MPSFFAELPHRQAWLKAGWGALLAILLAGCSPTEIPTPDPTRIVIPLPTAGPATAVTRQAEPSATAHRAITPIPALVEYLDQIALRWEEGDTAGAIEALDDLIAAEPGFCDALMLRAALHAEEGDDYEAFTDASQVIALSPGYVDAYLLRASLLEDVEERSLALIDLNVALALAPDRVDALVARGGLLAEMGDIEGAIADYQAAADTGEATADIYLTLGTLMNRAERYTDARESLLKARSDGKTGYDLNYQLALSSFFLGEFEEGLAYVDLALREAPESIEAISLRGTLHLNIAAWHSAEEDFTRILALSPGTIDAYYGLAQAQAGSGKREEAIDSCEAYLSLAQPTDRNYTAVSALLTMLSGDWIASPTRTP